MSAGIDIKRRTEASKGFEKAFTFLKDRLLSGSLRPGDRLIPERELAAQLGVSRGATREALRALHALGLIEIHERTGSVVRQPDASVLGDFFAFTMMNQTDLIDDIMEARMAIECQAIRLATVRATISDYERLRQALVYLRETIDDPEKGGDADYHFHRAMVAAAKSQTLSVLYDSIAVVLVNSHINRRRLVAPLASLQKIVIDDHYKIFDVIVDGDPEKADRALREHLSIGDDLRRGVVTANNAGDSIR